MNKNFTDRLEVILKAEREEKEKIERKKQAGERKLQLKENIRLRKLRGLPFNF